MGWLAFGTWREHHAEHQMDLVFGQYLEKFARDPQAAQQFLLASYEGCAVDADLAVDTVGYRPVVADGMPEGYSLESTCVVKMPCCTCVQCLFQRNDGTTVAVFEHDNAEAVWFGDRPETEAICNGKRCSMVALDDKLAATWRRGKRHITVVGAQTPRKSTDWWRGLTTRAQQPIEADGGGELVAAKQPQSGVKKIAMTRIQVSVKWTADCRFTLADASG